MSELNHAVYNRIKTPDGSIWEATVRVATREIQADGKHRTEVFTIRGAVGGDAETLIKTIETFRQVAIQSTSRQLDSYFNNGRATFVSAPVEGQAHLRFLMWKDPNERVAKRQWKVLASRSRSGVGAPIAIPFKKMKRYYTWDEKQILIRKKEHGFVGRTWRELAPTMIAPYLKKMVPSLKMRTDWVKDEAKRAEAQVKAKNHSKAYAEKKQQMVRRTFTVEMEPVGSEED